MVNLHSQVTRSSSTTASSEKNLVSTVLPFEADGSVGTSRLNISGDQISQNLVGDGCDRCSTNNTHTHGRVKSTVDYAALNNGYRTVPRNVNKREKSGAPNELDVDKPETTPSPSPLLSPRSAQVNAAFRKVRLDHSYCKQYDEGALIDEQLKEKRKRIQRIRDRKRERNGESDPTAQNDQYAISDFDYAIALGGSPVAADRPKARGVKSPGAEDSLGVTSGCRAKSKRQADSTRASPLRFDSPSRVTESRGQSPLSSTSASPQTQSPPKSSRQRPSINATASDRAAPLMPSSDGDQEDDELRLLRQLEERERAQRERELALRAVSRTASLHDDFVVDLGGVRIRPSRRRASKLPPNAIDLITAESQAGSSKRVPYNSSPFMANGFNLLQQRSSDSNTSLTDKQALPSDTAGAFGCSKFANDTRTLIDPAYTSAIERCRLRNEEERQSLLNAHDRIDTVMETILIGADRLADGDLSTSVGTSQVQDPVPCTSSESLNTVSTNESPSKLVDNLANWLTAMRQDEADVLLEKLLDPATSAAPTNTECTPPRASVASTAVAGCAPISSLLSSTLSPTVATLEHGDSLMSGVDIDDLVVVTVSKNDERDALDSPRTAWKPSCAPDYMAVGGAKYDGFDAQRQATAPGPLPILNPIGGTADSGATRTPQLTVVSMFWNDLPALLIDGVEHVRLVDIHKQMLPAKPTGLLKARAAQLSIGVVPCTDLERDFLIRYAHAAPAKSNWCVPVAEAKRLVSYYVNPLNHHRQNAHANSNANLNAAQQQPAETRPQSNGQSSSKGKTKAAQRRVNAQPATQPEPANARRVDTKKRNRPVAQPRAAPTRPTGLSKQRSGQAKRKAARNNRPASNAQRTKEQDVRMDMMIDEEHAGSAYDMDAGSQFEMGMGYASTGGRWSGSSMRKPIMLEPVSADVRGAAVSPAAYRVPARMVVHTAVRR